MPSRPLCDSFTQQIPLVHLLCVNCFNLGDPGEPDNQRTHFQSAGRSKALAGTAPPRGGVGRAEPLPGRPAASPRGAPQLAALLPPAAWGRRSRACGLVSGTFAAASGRTLRWLPGACQTLRHTRPAPARVAPLRNSVFADGRSGREGPSARRAGVWGPLQRRGPARDCGWPSLGRRRGCVARSSLTLPVNPEGRQGGFGSGVTLSLSAVLLGPRETT